MANIKDFNWVLSRGYFPSLAYGDGLNVFIIDTGTIIDLENFFYNGNRESENLPVNLIMQMERAGSPLVIPSRVFREIKTHCDCRLENRFEISPETSILLHKLYIESGYFLEEAGLHSMSIPQRDLHRYAVRSAAEEAFEQDYRKGYKDRMSDTDVETLSLALDLTSCSYNGVKIGTVNILSPDEHLSGAVSVLKNNERFKREFGNRGLRAIHTRKDLRSYLQK